MKDTLIVNLYGGPGSGKSTGAAYIFSMLKMVGVDAEYRYFIPKGNLPRWRVKKFLEKCRCDGLFKQAIENQQLSTTCRFC